MAVDAIPLTQPASVAGDTGASTDVRTWTDNVSDETQAGNFDLKKTGGSRVIDVVREWPWTLTETKNRGKLNDVPEIILIEHRNTESAIKRNLLFHGKGVGGEVLSGIKNIAGSVMNGVGWLASKIPGVSEAATLSKWALGMKEPSAAEKAAAAKLLEVYQDIFPDNPTGNKYYFPYFSKTFLELDSPNWEQLDDLDSAMKNMTGGLASAGKAAEGMGMSSGGTVAKYANNVQSVVSGLGSLGATYLKTQYPVVGIFDRPRIFSSHNERSITIEFPLYNTFNPDDWKQNRDLIYLMMTQFLYLKNSYITGFPPVFYRVLIPGEYFSFASCVTNFKVANLGNIRKLYGFNVPDAYQISLTLREMCMPSLNQFQAMTTGEAAQKVQVSIEGGLAAGARQ